MERPRILVVEDDPALREGYVRVLELADYDVSQAATGQAALDLAAAEHPDVAVLDVRLPDMSGIEVCRRIKRDPRLAGTQVVVATGVSTSAEQQAEGIEAGADAYLTKPVHMRTLLAHVRKLLEARRAEAARELATLDRFSRVPHGAAARSLGILPLSESIPALFQELVQDYGELLEAALSHRLYKDGLDLPARVRALGDQLGYLKAGPRDVVQVHHAALQCKSRGATPSRVRAYIEEGRLVMLQLMGHLLSHYRNYALSLRSAAPGQVTTPAAGEPAEEPR